MPLWSPRWPTSAFQPFNRQLYFLNSFEASNFKALLLSLDLIPSFIWNVPSENMQALLPSSGRTCMGRGAHEPIAINVNW